MSGLQLLYQKSSSIGLFFALAIFLFIWFPVQELFSYIPDYKEGIYVFLFLMIGRMFDMYCGLNGTIFSTSRKFKFDLLFSLFLCFSVFFLNIWLIPIYGITGAAISTGLAYIVYNLLRCFFIYSTYGLHPIQPRQALLFLYFIAFLLGIILINHLLKSEKWNLTPLLMILMNVLFVFLGFVLPIYFLKLEPNTNEFVNRLYKKIVQKKATYNQNER